MAKQLLRQAEGDDSRAADLAAWRAAQADLEGKLFRLDLCAVAKIDQMMKE